jgi:hypothetical protein
MAKPKAIVTGTTAALTAVEKPPGVCRVCGCVEEDGCEEGCGWVDRKKTLCTACEQLGPGMHSRRRQQAVSELTMRIFTTRQELEALERRLEVLRP